MALTRTGSTHTHLLAHDLGTSCKLCPGAPFKLSSGPIDVPASSHLLDGPEGPLDVAGLLGRPWVQPHPPALSLVLSPLAPGWGPCADPLARFIACLLRGC